MKRSFFAIVFILAVSCMTLSAAGEKKFFSDGTVFYLNHRGGELRIDVTLGQQQEGVRNAPLLRNAPSAMLAVYNPAGEVAAKRYFRVSGTEKSKKFTFNFPAGAAGVWQIRNSFSSNNNMAIELKTVPNLKYGVLFSRCRILNEDLPNIADSWFVVPPVLGNLNHHSNSSYRLPVGKFNKLRIDCRGAQTEFYNHAGRKIAQEDIFMVVGAQPDLHGNSNFDLPFGTTERAVSTVGPSLTVSDADGGRKIMQLTADSSAQAEIAPGTLCRLQIRPQAQGYITIDGFPVILCPDRETAAAIGASVENGRDGRLYAHKIQVRMAEWMQSLKPEELKIEPVSLETLRTAFMQDKTAIRVLPQFANAHSLFALQNLDKNSPGYGSAPVNLDDLVFFVALDRPYNPYFGNKALVKRAMLYYFRNMLPLTEAGVMYDNSDNGAYCGGTEWTGWESMALLNDYTALAMLAPFNAPELTRLWADILSFQVHRMWSTRLACENQSLHWPHKMYALHAATGEKIYKDMADDYIRDFADPEMSRTMRTGYPVEAYGLDGTYTGISTSLLAFASRFAGNDAALPVLRRIFFLMNHTVVREPSGALVAANGFAHRTTGSWLNRQYGGGSALMADKIEDAAVLEEAVKPLSDAEYARVFGNYCDMQKSARDHAAWAKKDGEVLTRYSLDCWLPTWPQTFFRVAPLSGAKLPVERENSFVRDFNGEFQAWRTPGYYAFVYSGKYSWRRHNWRYENTPLAVGAAFSAPDRIHSSHPSRTWLAMQGMNIFWTPRFGAFLLARNWTMYTQNIMRADRDGKVADFPVCWSMEAERDGNNVLTMKHTGKFLPLNYNRQMTFAPGAVKVGLNVTATENLSSAVELIEQLPFLRKEGLKIQASIGGRWRDLPAVGVEKLRASLPDGAGVLVEFSRPVAVKFGPDSTAVNNPNQMNGLLEVTFSRKFTGRNKASLSYEIKADDLK